MYNSDRHGAGDSVAAPVSVRELFIAYADGVYTLGVRMLRDRHAAEDLVQETFVTVLRRLAIRDGRVVGKQVGAGSQSDVERMFRVAGGEPGTRRVLGGTDRLLRTAAAAVLTVVGYLAAAWWLTAFGVLLLAAGWYDLAIPRNRAEGRSHVREEPATIEVLRRQGRVSSPLTTGRKESRR